MFTTSNELRWTEQVTAPRAARISPQEWDQHHAVILEMHNRGMTKQDIRAAMSQKGFNATLHQYTEQYKKWGLTRYNKPAKITEAEPSVSVQTSDGNSNVRSMVMDESDIVMGEADMAVSSSLAMPLTNPFISPDENSESTLPQELIDLADTALSSNAANPFIDPPELDETRATTMGEEVSLHRGNLDSTVPDTTSTTGPDGDFASETASVRTVGTPTATTRVLENVTGGSLRMPVYSSTSQQAIPEDTTSRPVSVDEVAASFYEMSLQDHYYPDSTATSFRDSQLDSRSITGESVWESIATQSEVSLLREHNAHIMTLTDKSKAIPHNQYLAQLYPRQKLKLLRKFAAKHIFHDWSAIRILNSIMAEADFFRVSLLFSEAFDLYLLVYMLLTDKKTKREITVNKHMILRTVAGCSESARSLSQVRLCQSFLENVRCYHTNDFLVATGFPLKYWHGHLAALENQSGRASVCIQQAVAEVGRLRFSESAAVTSVFVRELIARYRHMGLCIDNTSLWLQDAQLRLNNGEFPATMAAALRDLLQWCISTMVKDKVDTTIQDCFANVALSQVTKANGNKTPQHALLLVVHMFCTWGEENETSDDGPSWLTQPEPNDATFNDPASEVDLLADTLETQRPQKRGSPGNEAIDLITKEMGINLLSLFTTMSRMIAEQSPIPTTSGFSLTAEDSLSHLRNNAINLTKLSGEDLEGAFVKSYFFVNTRALELGYGLHPRRFLRAIAAQNLPRRIVVSGIGPDWLSDASDTSPTPSVRTPSVHSANSSRRRLLVRDPSEPALPQPSPRSSISVRMREAVNITKRKYQSSVSSRVSGGSQTNLPTKILKRDTTGGTNSSAGRQQLQSEQDVLRMMGVSMSSLHLSG